VACCRVKSLYFAFNSLTRCYKLILRTGFVLHISAFVIFNPLTPNDPYNGRTAPLTSKVAFYIFIQQIGTEYFKQGIHSPFFRLQNAVCFIILTYLVLVLFTFYIQGVLK